MSDNSIDDGLFDTAEAAQVESGAPTKSENIAGLMNKKKPRTVIAATAGAVLLVGGILAVLVMNQPKPPQAPTAPEARGTAEVGEAPNPGDMREQPNPELRDSKAYQEVVAGVLQAEAGNAAQAGQSYQPAVASWGARAPESAASSATTPMPSAPPPGQQAGAGYQAPPQAPAYVPTPEEAEQARQARMAYLTVAAQAIATVTTNTRERGSMVVTMPSTPPAAAGGNPGQPTAGVPGAGGAQAAAGTTQPTTYTLIGAGTIESARVDNAVNTDFGTEFVATLVTGRYAGARLVGSYQRTKDRAMLAVKSMTIPGQGVTVAVTGTVLDADSREAGTATDVDNKVLTKYVLKPLAVGLAAVGEAAKSSGSTTVIANGEVVTTTPELTGKRVRQIVGGSAAGSIAGDAEAIDTTPTVRVAPGTIVGVLFTSDVLYTPRSTGGTAAVAGAGQ